MCRVGFVNIDYIWIYNIIIVCLYVRKVYIEKERESLGGVCL